MTCDRARDMFFEAQDGLQAPADRARLHAHLAGCDACRAEFARLTDAAAALTTGLYAMAGAIVPSPAFWHDLTAGLDGIDTERAPAPSVVAAQPNGMVRLRAALVHRWMLAAALLAALVAALLGSGGLQQAWADLRHRLYFLPVVGVGQVDQTALVATSAASASNGTLTLTVRDVVAGRHITLLLYQISGPALAVPDASAQVADAVDAALIGARGTRYIPLSVLQSTRGTVHGVQTVQGGLAFTPLARDERTVVLQASRLPLAPIGRPWSVRIALQPVGATAAITSRPVDSSAVHRGIRLSVTDLTRTDAATVVDMAARIEAGPYAGGSVVSLTPETAVGAYAPVLSRGSGAGLAARLAPLPAPVRLVALPQPEFVFPPLPAGHGAFSLRVAAVGVLGTDRMALRIDAGAAQTVRLGGFTLRMDARAVVPPAALGMGDERRLRLSVAFPAAMGTGALQRVTLLLDGVAYAISRDNPSVDLPLPAGRTSVQATLEQPLISVQGPWLIGLPNPSS